MRAGTQMNLKKRLVNMKGDLSGAVSAAIISIPLSNCFFPDIDAALEWAENNVLTQSLELAGASDRIQLEQMDILRDFTPQEINALEQKLTRKTCNKGEIIAKENPQIAIKLIRNIALEMSDRLRIRTNEVSVLEEG
jgi:hypothetical protein